MSKIFAAELILARAALLGAFLCFISLCVKGAEAPLLPDGVDFRVLPAKIGTWTKWFGVGDLAYRGGIMLQSRDASFGRFSGLHISPDGEQLFAVGGGKFLKGALSYDASGNLTGFELMSIETLKDTTGEPLTGEDDQDAEALYFNGSAYLVGFEGNNRIWSYSSLHGPANPKSLPVDLTDGTPEWGGFSSITGSPDGLFMTMTEGGTDAAGNTKGWIQDGDASGLVWLRADPGWLLVDMSLLPGGDLLVLEVAVGPALDGGRPRPDHNRISKIAAAELRPGNVMQAREIALLKPRQYYEKIEALHAMQSSDGRMVVYLMSDSSQHWPTHVLMFELTP